MLWEQRSPTQTGSEGKTPRSTMDMAKLALEDGTVFTGRAFGARGEVDGEVVFNTSMTGYQEILTDPSYHGQIVAMTYPADRQLRRQRRGRREPPALGPRVRRPRAEPARQQLPRGAGRSTTTSPKHGIIGIEGIDTRALVRLTRVRGAMKGILSTTDLDDASLVAKARKQPRPGRPRPGPRGHARARASPGSRAWIVDSCSTRIRRRPGFSRRRTEAASARVPHVVALDFGMKWNILRHLVEIGCRVTVVPGSTPAEAILEHQPDGIFLSNGPGDPARARRGDRDARRP